MRTTITLDDDIARRVEETRHQEGLTFKAAINLLLRLGLERGVRPVAPATPYRIRPVHTGPPLVDLTRSSELLVLDDEAVWRQGPR